MIWFHRLSAGWYGYLLKKYGKLVMCKGRGEVKGAWAHRRVDLLDAEIPGYGENILVKWRLEPPGDLPSHRRGPVKPHAVLMQNGVLAGQQRPISTFDSDPDKTTGAMGFNWKSPTASCRLPTCIC